MSNESNSHWHLLTKERTQKAHILVRHLLNLFLTTRNRYEGEDLSHHRPQVFFKDPSMQDFMHALYSFKPKSTVNTSLEVFSCNFWQLPNLYAQPLMVVDLEKVAQKVFCCCNKCCVCFQKFPWNHLSANSPWQKVNTERVYNKNKKVLPCKWMDKVVHLTGFNCTSPHVI